MVMFPLMHHSLLLRTLSSFFRNTNNGGHHLGLLKFLIIKRLFRLYQHSNYKEMNLFDVQDSGTTQSALRCTGQWDS
ncbi:hypothetical protein FRX31_017605 [Thalictrum thalictroides]|uniref:Uncharacterized protein n=1 Tax=Thalictrum thalictroides TaxID=46969 RepID=A0A7J6W7B7_THATH|nr:hypothetical protein FRX31_017605 [Thalictrum thalictroides]